MNGFLPYGAMTNIANNIVNEGAQSVMSDKRFLEKEIKEWKDSAKRQEMIVADQYYNGDHPIKFSKREVIGEGGNKVEVDNLPNNRIIDNQYQKAVDEKKNYIMAKPLTITAKDSKYGETVKKYYNAKMHRTLNRVCRESIDKGVAFLYPYYDSNSVLRWKHFRSWDIIPFFEDEERTILEAFGRLYTIEGYEGEERKVFEFFDYYTADGIKHYRLEGGRLFENELEEDEPYASINVPAEGGYEKKYFNWQRIPLIVFKRNEKEIPLIRNTKSIQDAINRIVSNFVNNMEEDVRNTIMVLINYDGENLGDFRQKLSTYGAVKVTTIDGQAGDVKTLQVQVNAENYKAILGILKEALVENARSFNVKDNRLTSDANQMHIQTAYHDMDLDADDMEVEWQAAFEEMMFFINADIKNKGGNVPEDATVTFTFNRNMMIDENAIIQNCVVSKDIISDETIRAKHPWCVDPEKEKQLLSTQMKEEVAYNPTGKTPTYKDGEDE
jgi:SPP1 family phage portal protein